MRKAESLNILKDFIGTRSRSGESVYSLSVNYECYEFKIEQVLRKELKRLKKNEEGMVPVSFKIGKKEAAK